MSDTLIIGVTGGSGSGKSTLINNLEAAFPGDVCVLRHDSYYRRQAEPSYELRARVNYDHPDAYETELMLTHLDTLRHGESVECPVYDFTVHNRSDQTVTLSPAPVILLDGILILADARLRAQMDIKVFVDTDADVRFIRRLRRDTRKRGRSMDSVIDQYLTTVKPMYEQFVAPSRRYADLIIPEGGKNVAALDVLTSRIRRHLSQSDGG